MSPALRFGPFTLVHSRQLLLEGERPLRLGSRALDILAVLVERPGELITKDELISRVWPHTVVEDINLRVHVAALRKALGDGLNGARYISNVPGRGYCFVAPVIVDKAVPPSSLVTPQHNLPARLSRLVGRGDTVSALAAQLRRRRFVTITGPGGMGKTAVALAVAEAVLTDFADGVRFVDLAALADPRRVASTIANALGVALPDDAPQSALLQFLQSRRMLLVLDNCEHLIDECALLAELLLKRAPGMHLLATSHEPLRADGEWIHGLPALPVPSAEESLTATRARGYAAVQLFVERARASQEDFELGDAEAPLVGALCRRLDGMPLAIELAAARMDLLGLQGLVAHFEGSSLLHTQGRRTAAPRHQTLGGLLDWSHALLGAREQILLRRLSVFRSNFSLEAAIAVASDASIRQDEVLSSLLALSHKSLLHTDTSTERARHRLLDITRSYASIKLLECGEQPMVLRRLAQQLRQQLLSARDDWQRMPREAWVTQYRDLVAEVRAALDWAFSPSGDAGRGAVFPAAAMPLGFQLGLPDEFRAWIMRALAAVSSPTNTDLQMRLYLALGHLLGQTQGDAAALHAFEQAAGLSTSENRAEGLAGLFAGHFGAGSYARAHECAAQLMECSPQTPGVALSARRMQAQALHFAGHHTEAQQLVDRVLTEEQDQQPLGHIPVNRMVSLGIVRARLLWLQGFPEQGLQEALDSVERGSQDFAFSLCQALALSAVPIALWMGELPLAHQLTDRLEEQALRQASALWQSWARGYAQILARRNDPEAPLPQVMGAKQLDHFITIEPGLLNAEVLLRAYSETAGWCAPEIWRLQAERLPDADEAEALLQRAMALAQHQGAMAWQLRCATSLARHWIQRDRHAEARALLSPIHGRFTEGHNSADMQQARRELQRLWTAQRRRHAA
jgi:predicted ATPase/DNA-binding winged helix-turn-helix (wHTH) protein